MRSSSFLLAIFLGGASIFAAPGGSSTYTPTVVVDYWPTPTSKWSPPTPTWSQPPHKTDCGDDCGGVCGDKIVQKPYEECDLGPALNGAPGSGCSATCKWTHWCGDGKTDAWECCDLGPKNGVWGSGCSANCTCVGWCGDGKKDAGEDCDLGPLNGKWNSGCSDKCKKLPVCGNGVREEGETCDLGHLNGKWNSGCSEWCKCTPVCGNGIKEEGEECDAGGANGAYSSGCTEKCKLCGYCGDKIVDDAAGEQCDLGFLLNGAPGQPCSADCKTETCTYKCGNGVTEPGEQCDYGALNGPNSKCSKECKWNTCLCGNGITEYPEECDDGPLTGKPGSKCDKDCKWIEPCGNPWTPKCGDGIVTWPEVCDDGWRNGKEGSNCTTDCTWCSKTPPRCGDGHVDPGEDCDDGKDNGSKYSYCSSTCKKCTPPGNPPPKTSTCPCETCNPNPFFNKCHITTSCISTPSKADYCACRAGYRANDLAPTDGKQFRLKFEGQGYRVFVAPGVSCDTLCTAPFPGPDSCKEVPIHDEC